MASIQAGKRLRSRSFKIKKPGDLSKKAKKIEKLVATKSSAEVRSNIIDSAYYIRDEVARSAPLPRYGEIIMSLPLEKADNYNSGFDVVMNGSFTADFILKIPTRRFFYRGEGWNPMVGLLVSNYGRNAINTTVDNKMPIPDVNRISSSTIDYNHPRFGTGRGGRYGGLKVVFTTHVDPIPPTHWIENAVEKASRKANDILAGISDYKVRNTTDTFWG